MSYDVCDRAELMTIECVAHIITQVLVIGRLFNLIHIAAGVPMIMKGRILRLLTVTAHP